MTFGSNLLISMQQHISIVLVCSTVGLYRCQILTVDANAKYIIINVRDDPQSAGTAHF